VVAVAATAAWSVVAVIAADAGRLLPVVLPVAAVWVAVALCGVVRQLESITERRRLRALFAQYVPASVVEQLVASGRGQQAASGERVALTALFCDLRSFTPLAARLEPSQVRDLLNVFYEALAGVVFDAGGTVLQYTGDDIFAVFGAPLPDPDHAPRALACARRMFDRLPALNDELASRGLPPLNYGIGLHSGDAVAAHVGSSVRMQYAVIGDTINVASRHCTLAREGQIMLSDVTKALIGDVPDAEPINGVQLKGVADERQVHRIQQGPPWVSGDPALLRRDDT
jgi:adenylate cyclase